MKESCLFICLAAAGLWDVRDGRIPNRWIGFWYILGFGVSAFSGWLAAAGYLIRTAAAAGIFFLFFLCRMMGAGDIKCMALICGYLGLPSGIKVIGLGMAFGAVWSFARLAVKGLARPRMEYLSAYIGQIIREKKIIPYYVPERDGKDVVLPLAACLFFGYGLYLLYAFAGNYTGR